MAVSKRATFARCVIVVASLGIAACGSGTATPSAAPTRVVLRSAASTQSGGYPTPYGAVRAGIQMTTLIFDTLAFPDSTGQVKPWLARSWQESADATTWTFQLHNATFQDGTPLTSADVVFSFNYDISGPGGKSGATFVPGLNLIKSVTAEGPETVVFKLTAPDSAFLASIAGEYGVFIIPQHIWASVTDPAHFQGTRALVGSGPYELKTFDPSTNSYDFVANDNFYLGKPVVKELQIVPAGDPLLALQRGQLDSASTGNGPVAPAEMSLLSKSFKLLTAPGEFNEALFFNLAAGFPYNQTAFRQAVAYALNRPDMIQRLASGHGTPGSAGGLGPDNPYLDKNLPAYTYDPAKAKTLLDQVGLRVPIGSTYRVGPDGSAFTIPLLTSSSDEQQATLVSNDLEAVGLKVQVTAVDQASSDAADQRGDYKMAIVHFGGLGGDPGLLVNEFSSNYHGASFTHVHGYANPTFNALADQQATAVSVSQRKQLLDQMQAIIAADVPELPLYYPDQLSFVNTNVFHGWGYTPGCPACGVGMSKRNLVTGSAAPATAA